MAAPKIGMTVIVLGRHCEWLLTLHLAVPRLLGALVVQFAADDDAPPLVCSFNGGLSPVIQEAPHSEIARPPFPSLTSWQTQWQPPGSIP
jgi:hypothetical protein